MSYQIGKNFWLSEKRLCELAMECEEYLQVRLEKYSAKLEATYTELKEIHEDWFSEMTENECYEKFVKLAEDGKIDLLDSIMLNEDIDELSDALDDVYFSTKHIKRLEYKIEITSRTFSNALCGIKVDASDMEPTLKLAKNRGTLYKKAS